MLLSYGPLEVCTRAGICTSVHLLPFQSRHIPRSYSCVGAAGAGFTRVGVAGTSNNDGRVSCASIITPIGFESGVIELVLGCVKAAT